MSLTATVTKKSVSRVASDKAIVTINLLIEDTEGPGFTKDYSLEKNNGEGVGHNSPLVKSAMQLDINNYKNEQTIFKSAALDTVITNIQGGLNL